MDSARVPEFERLIAGVDLELDRRGLRFMLIGGQAVLLHGEPRLTQDIDITLAAPPSRAPEILSVCLHKLFAGRARDLEDARGVVVRQGDKLDWPYIERWAREFSAAEGRENLPELVRRLRAQPDEGRSLQ